MVSEEWQQPIKIYNHALEKTAFLKESVRVIFPDYATDSAVILCSPKELDFPKLPIPLLPMDTTIEIGVEVGWVGYSWKGATFSCPFCSAVLGAGIDPVALKNTIVNELMDELKKSR